MIIFNSQSVRTAMHGAMVAVEEKMKQKKEIQQKKVITDVDNIVYSRD